MMEWEYRRLTWDTKQVADDTFFVSARGHLLDKGWEELTRIPHWGVPGGICIMGRRKGGDVDWQYLALEMVGQFESCRNTLIGKGWEEWIRIHWFGEGTVAVCIMRRPKDEPRKWSEGEAKALAQRIAGKLTLWHVHASGWTEAQLVSVIQGALTEPMPESRISSEPRMWTEGGIEEIAKKVLAHGKDLFESILEDAQTEADMQTAWNKDLLKRNEELQAAIDAMVVDAQMPGRRSYTFLRWAIRKHLYPLATKKEETNGI